MRRGRVGVGILLVAVSAGALWSVLDRRTDGVLVDLGRVERRSVFRSYVTASGEIVAARYADIGSSVMGKVVRLPVVEGQRVKEADLLAVIDPVPARSELDAAEAQVRALEAEVSAAEARATQTRLARQRADRLKAQGLIPAAQHDQAAAEADTAEAQLTAARRRAVQARAQAARARDLVEKTEIRAPMSGTVTQRRVRRGEMVVVGIQNQPGTILMTVSDLSAIDADVKVAEADVLGLELEQLARISLEALPGRTFVGRIGEIGASALPITGTGAAAREFRVVIRLENPDPSLRPGLTCDAEILTAERRDVLTVPLQSVALRPGPDGVDRSGVFVVEERQARFLPVTTGIIGALEIQVEGLDAGRQVVNGPYQVLRELQDGQPVRVADGSED